jgi:hypothetical protein
MISVNCPYIKPKVQLRVDNLETRAILGSSPWTITHNTEYNNDEEHGPHQKEIYNSGYLSEEQYILDFMKSTNDIKLESTLLPYDSFWCSVLMIIGSPWYCLFIKMIYRISKLDNIIYTVLRGCLYMDNSLISCLCYFIYLYRTVVKRSDSLLLYIVFIILLVQSVINLENICDILLRMNV